MNIAARVASDDGLVSVVEGAPRTAPSQVNVSSMWRRS
jgi:hypothetical protein